MDDKSKNDNLPERVGDSGATGAGSVVDERRSFMFFIARRRAISRIFDRKRRMILSAGVHKRKEKHKAQTRSKAKFNVGRDSSRQMCSELLNQHAVEQDFTAR